MADNQLSLTVTQLTYNVTDDARVRIDGDSIVWQRAVDSDAICNNIIYYNSNTLQMKNISLNVNGYNHMDPYVSGNTVVWKGVLGTYSQFNRTESVVYKYDGAVVEEVSHSVDDNYNNIYYRYQNFDPYVYGDTVVWWQAADSASGTQLYAYVDNGNNFRYYLAPNISLDIWGGKFIKISGNNIVWQGNNFYASSNIYLYNGVEILKISNDDTVIHSNPQIDGNHVVWTGTKYNITKDIFYYNGSQTVRITNDDVEDNLPQVSGDNVVWVKWDGTDYEIMLFNGSEIKKITNNEVNDYYPQISGNNVIWQGWDGNTWQIYLFNGSETFQVSQGSFDNQLAQISGNSIVWQGRETVGGDYEIFLASMISVINGDSGADNLFGTSGDDIINGFSGNDILDGGLGTDIMIGGTGNDVYYVDNVADVTTETSTLATEIDTVISTVTRTLGANLERLTLSGTAAINGTGNGLNNTLVGNSAANVLNGGTGIDTMIGGTGNDTYYVDNASDVTSETSTLAAEIDTVVSSVTRTLGANLEKLTLNGTVAINGTGNGLGNTLVGNTAANVLNGGIGIDTMIGGLGNDIYYVDNAGDVISETSTLAIEIDTVVSNVTRTLGANLEKLVLTGTAPINGTGNTLHNTLVGNAAANVLNGGGGNDILNGGSGADALIGGTGNDIYYVDNAGDVTTETGTLATEIDTVISSVTRTLGANLERLTLSGTAAINGTGNTLNNSLVGNSSANVLNGGTGIDTLIGGNGSDTYYVDNAADITTETSTLATEIDTVVSSVTRTLGANIEKLTLNGTTAINGTGNTLNNTLFGNTAANILNGGGGNDILNGGTGIDTMIGGRGNDTYYVDNAGDVTTESSTLATEIDTVVSSVTRTVGVNLERLTLSGTAAINGTGNTLNNSLFGNTAANMLNGNSGNDVLNGGLGNDTLIGGAGIDTFVFDSVLNATTNRDTLTDFSVVDDTLCLDQTVFAKLTTLGSLNAGLFRSSATGAAGDGNDYILYNSSTGALAYDADGIGSGLAIRFATLTARPAITASDFVVVA